MNSGWRILKRRPDESEDEAYEIDGEMWSVAHESPDPEFWAWVNSFERPVYIESPSGERIFVE